MCFVRASFEWIRSNFIWHKLSDVIQHEKMLNYAFESSIWCSSLLVSVLESSLKKKYFAGIPNGETGLICIYFHFHKCFLLLLLWTLTLSSRTAVIINLYRYTSIHVRISAFDKRRCWNAVSLQTLRTTRNRGFIDNITLLRFLAANRIRCGF